MTERSALILYGSETGTAQDGAEEIGKMLVRLHFAVQVLELNEVDLIAVLKPSLVICTISTTGQGDVPINARLFWKRLLKRKLTSTYLASMKFAIFGFGDSSYPKYNHAGLKLHKRLLQLGALPIISMGKGDEQHPEGHDATFSPWLAELRTQILASFPCPTTRPPIPNDELLPPAWLLTLRNPELSDGVRDIADLRTVPIVIQRNSASSSVRDIHVRLDRNKRVTPQSHWQDVRHLVFSSEVQLSYVPGDVLVIYPHNSPEQVSEIINLMEWENVADRKVVFAKNPDVPSSSSTKPPSLQTASGRPAETLRDLLMKHLDFNSIPRRSFFGLIAHFTDDEIQKARLLEFSNPEYLDELYDYTTRPRRSILEVLQEFDTVRIPWQWAAVVFPSLRGRQFSIASGGALCHGPNSSTKFELLVAIVKYQTIIRKIRRGVCSRYLESLEPGSTIFATLQKGGLDLTSAELSQPAVLIGPGTGIAPIRSLLWHRLANRIDRGGDCALFFGCRNKMADYFFESEWEDLKQSLPLDVFPAFSRDQADKQYVQDLIRSHGKTIYEIIYKDKGMIFVCGSSGKMPLAVRQAIKDALIQESIMTEIDVEIYLATMEKENRYKQETW